MVSVVLDTSGYIRGKDDDALEEAISKAAGYADAFISGGYIVRLATSAGEVPFGTGGPHRRRIMTHLALFNPLDQPQATPNVRGGENKVIISLKNISKPEAA